MVDDRVTLDPALVGAPRLRHWPHHAYDLAMRGWEQMA